MANGEINGVFIYNGQPQNGALAKLWKITGFASYADSTDEVESTPLEAVDIELTVNAGGTFAIGGVIKMGTELCRITDISTNLLYIIRGYRGTTPAQHVQNVQIDDETITEPAQDTAIPAGYQQGGDVTTGVAYGGDGAYRWTAVPEGEYYVSVYYDAHRAWLYASVETNDVTLEQVLRADGDLPLRNADGVTRLPTSTIGHYLRVAGTGRAAWQGGAGAANLTVAETEEFNGAAPVAWTDLDLSGTVGANVAFVILKLSPDANNAKVAVRKNGDTDDFWVGGDTADARGCALSNVDSGDHIVLVVFTDAAGKIEWIASAADTYVIDIMGYIN